MKLSILVNDGSPIGVSPGTIQGDQYRVGVGGAELALLTLAEYWTEIGHEVVLYNNPWYVTPTLEQRPIATFNPKEDRDYLIIFRSPNRASFNAKGKKIWWSCDQYTVGDFREFGGIVDQIVTISPYHREYFQNQYRLDSTAIDLPVREQDYVQEIEKVPYRMLFSSVPGRGLDILAQCYPAIKARVPEASLVITSDYRLWGASPNNEVYRSAFFGKPDVAFLGAVPRNRLVEEQYKADIMSYPSSYDELFCIACAESQWVGSLPITTTIGSLTTTNMGIRVEGDFRSPYWIRNYVDAVASHLRDRETLKKNQDVVRKKARERFSLEVVNSQWDSKVFN